MSALLDTPFDLPAGAREQFEADGFIKLKDVLDEATIAEFEPEITGQVIELNTQRIPLEKRSTYDKAFLQIENLWQHSEKAKEFAFSSRLARIATELLGTKGVRLYHDQALYKEPHGGFTPWHADQFYWPVDSDRTCTVWVPLQATPSELGPLSFARGSHKLVLGQSQELGDESEKTLAEAVANAGVEHVNTPYDLGEVSFHFGWTVHRADPNVSDRPRKVMTMIYLDKDIHVTEPENRPHKRELERWLSNATPGSIPDGPLNPVLYSAS